MLNNSDRSTGMTVGQLARDSNLKLRFQTQMIIMMIIIPARAGPVPRYHNAGPCGGGGRESLAVRVGLAAADSDLQLDHVTWDSPGTPPRIHESPA